MDVVFGGERLVAPSGGGLATADPQLTLLTLDQLADPARGDDLREPDVRVAVIFGGVVEADLLGAIRVQGPAIHAGNSLFRTLDQDLRCSVRHGLPAEADERRLRKIEIPAGSEVAPLDLELVIVD